MPSTLPGGAAAAAPMDGRMAACLPPFLKRFLGPDCPSVAAVACAGECFPKLRRAAAGIPLRESPMNIPSHRKHFADRRAGPRRRRWRRRQDAGVLLRRQPRKLLPRRQHHRHLVRRQPADLQPHRRVRARRHQGRARPGREVGHLAPTALEYTFHLRKGVKWHNHRDFKPTRDFNADDMIFALRAPVEGRPTRTSRSPAPTIRTSTTWACPSC